MIDMLAGYFAYLEKLASLSGTQNDWRIRRMIHKANRLKDRNPEYSESVERRLLQLAEVQPTPFPRPPIFSLQAGNLMIGRNKWSGPFNIEFSALKHGLFLGKTRTGKTTAFAKVLLEIVEKTDIPTLSFDPKNSLRGIIKHDPRFYPVRLDEIKFNPFQIFVQDKKLQKRSIMDLWGIFARSSDLLVASRSFGFKIIRELLEEFEDKDSIPTLYDFRYKVKERKARLSPTSLEAKYAERILNRLDSLLFAFGDTFDCQRGFPTEEFMNPENHPILEWSGIDPSLCRTLILMLSQALFNKKLSSEKEVFNKEILIAMDEAEEIIGFESQYDRSKKGTPFISKLLERGSGLGMGFIFSSHHTKLTSTIFENLNSRFCFNLSSSDDVKKIASDMGLNKEQSEVIEELGVGEIVAKVSGKRDQPFTAKINPVSLPKISDQEVKKHSQYFLDDMYDKVVPRSKKKKPDKAKDTEDHLKLNMDENILLSSIADFPFLSTSKRRDHLNWGSNKITRISGKLRNAGLLRKKKLRTSGRGRARVLFELTGKSLDYLKKQGVKPKQSEGRGGVIHLYWVTKIKDFLEVKNYDVRKEVKIGQVIVDLLAIDKKGTRLAVEVEVTSAKNTASKLPEILKNVDKVVVV